MIKNAIWLFIITVLVLFFFLPTFTKMQNFRQKNLEYEAQIHLLQEKNIRLVEEARLLIEDPVYLERVAREKMSIARKGEVIFRLKPAEEEGEEKIAGFDIE